MKRIASLLCGILLLAAGATAWVGYGNPFREIPFYNPQHEDFDDPPFFAGPCDEHGLCQLRLEHKRLIHLNFSSWGGTDWERTVVGKGKNPIELMREAGLEFLPRPNYVEAAIKWCTNGPSIRQYRTHGSHYIVSISDNAVRTVRCIQEQVPGSFVASVGDPMQNETTIEPFVPLIKPWLERDKMLEERAASEQR